MLKVSDTPNKDGLWSVRDEENQRIALFYDDGLAREMVELFNAAQQSVQPTALCAGHSEGSFVKDGVCQTCGLPVPHSG